MVETYVLKLRGEPGHSAPADVRLRRCLKYLLRGFGLRVIEISEIKPEKSNEPSRDAKDERHRADAGAKRQARRRVHRAAGAVSVRGAHQAVQYTGKAARLGSASGGQGVGDQAGVDG